MATITLPKILANFETSLAAKMSDVATTHTLDVSTDDNGTTLSGLYQLTIDEGTPSEEHMYVTLSGASGTVVRRKLSRTDAWTEVDGNEFEHVRGATVKITNFSLILINRLLNGDDTFGGVSWLGVSSIAGLVTPTAGELTKAANVEYVNNTALSGAPDASDASKGVVEKATQTEVNEGDDTGSTTAPTVVSPSTHLQTWDMLVTTDYTYGATIAAGNLLYLDTADAKWKLADGDAAATADAVYGIAIDAGVDTNTGKRVQIAGVVTGLSGLTPGFQCVSATAGAIVAFASAPTYKKVVGFAPNATTLILSPGIRAEDLSGGNSNLTTASLNLAADFFATPSRQALKYSETAGHALADNEVVAIESDGKMYRSRPTGLPTTNAGTASNLTSTRVADSGKMLWFDQASEFKKVLLHNEAETAPDSMKLYNVVVDDNFDAVSSSNNASITTGTSINTFDAALFNTNQVAVVIDDNSNVKIGIFASVDGTPSAGSLVSLEASSNGAGVSDTSVATTLVAFSSGGGSDLRSHKVTVSGTTPTEGTVTAMVAEANAVPNAAYRFAGTDFIAVAYVNTSTGKLKVVIGEYNPTTGLWTSVGTPIELESSGADTFSQVIFQPISSSKIAIAWRKVDVKCAVISRTGTTAVLSNVLTAVSTTMNDGGGFKRLSTYSYLISAGTNAGGIMRIVALDRDQAEFSLVGSAYTNDSAGDRGISGCLLHPERILVAYQTGATTSSLRTQELATNLDAVIGIVEAAVATDGTEKVVLNGYMSGLSSLTAGQAYYTGIDGQLVTSDAGSGTRTANQSKPGNVRRIAVGLSATEAIVKS